MSESKSKNPSIECSENGPYIVRYLETLHNSRGESMECQRTVALCRCGGSANKPYCDGTHASIGFSGENLSAKSRDRLDTFAGKKITIHDNRGLCSHAGHCLAFRFKEGVDADRADFDAIVKAVQDCPSGAISYSIDGVRYNEEQRGPAIDVSSNGPYHVTGGVELRDVPKMEGSSAEHYTLCRCGQSKNKPFCDGTHAKVGFADEEN